MYTIVVEVRAGVSSQHVSMLSGEAKGKELGETLAEAMVLVDALAHSTIERAPLLTGLVEVSYIFKPEVPRASLLRAWQHAVYLLSAVMTVLPEPSGNVLDNANRLLECKTLKAYQEARQATEVKGPYLAKGGSSHE